MKLHFALLALLFTTGCATITRGTREVFTVDSTPQGANVQISTGQSGQTPLSVKVPRNETLHVTISKPGYKTRQSTVPENQPQVLG